MSICRNDFVDSNNVKKLHHIFASIARRSKVDSRSPQQLPGRLKDPTPLDLTLPHDILAPISTIRLSDKTRRELLCRLTGRLEQLQKECSALYLRMCLKFDNDDLDPIVRRSSEHFYYKQCLVVKTRLEEVAKQQKQVCSEKKGTFNNEYTPFLEKYFEYNAYPSAPDRLVLARKSKMSARQIEVWFQNHRNRAKKEGKRLPRLSSDLPLKISLDSLEEKIPLFSRQVPTPEEFSSDEGSGDEDLAVSPPTEPADIFNSKSPPHAFPAPYPPNCPDNPFPNDNGIFKFAPPVWRRRPAAKANPPKPAPLTMDEFVVMFTLKLSLVEALFEVQSRQKERNTSLTCRKPWFAATVTIPSPAPHPAFLRSICHPPPLLSVSSNVSAQKSIVCSRSGTPPSCQITSRSRKLAPLPRRSPISTAITSSTFSSSPLSSTPSSRASSFTSATTTQSRSTSSSSLVDPVSPPSSPTIQAQRSVITASMFEVFDQYLHARLQPQWNDLGFSSCMFAKQNPPFSQYQTSPSLSISDLHYLETRS